MRSSIRTLYVHERERKQERRQDITTVEAEQESVGKEWWTGEQMQSKASLRGSENNMHSVQFIVRYLVQRYQLKVQVNPPHRHPVGARLAIVHTETQRTTYFGATCGTVITTDFQPLVNTLLVECVLARQDAEILFWLVIRKANQTLESLSEKPDETIACRGHTLSLVFDVTSPSLSCLASSDALMI